MGLVGPVGPVGPVGLVGHMSKWDTGFITMDRSRPVSVNGLFNTIFFGCCRSLNRIIIIG